LKDESYLFEKNFKTKISSTKLEPKMERGLNFYVSPPFENFSRGAIPHPHPLAKLCLQLKKYKLGN
jgi:hypothetical protein